MKILFLNYELGFDAGSRFLQGWSTKVYGLPSRWNPVFAAQCCELEIKDEREYVPILKDLAMAYHMPLRKWIPVPDFANAIPPRAPAVVEFEAGYNLGMDRRELPDKASDAAKAGYYSALDTAELQAKAEPEKADAPIGTEVPQFATVAELIAYQKENPGYEPTMLEQPCIAKAIVDRCIDTAENVRIILNAKSRGELRALALDANTRLGASLKKFPPTATVVDMAFRLASVPNIERLLVPKPAGV